MKTISLFSKLMRSSLAFLSVIVIATSLMSFAKIEQIRADTSVQIPNIAIISTGVYDIPANGGEVTLSISASNTVYNDIESFINETNFLLDSKDDVDVCITSIVRPDHSSGVSTGYITLLFGRNVFDDEQTIGVRGREGGYVTVVQAAQ